MTTFRPQPRILDAIHPSGHAVAEVKFSVDAIRTVWAALLDLAFALGQYPEAHGFLVLVDPTVTLHRLREDWRSIHSVIRSDMLARITICVVTEGESFECFPQDPSAEWRTWLAEVVRGERAAMARHRGRPDFAFVLQKLLLYQSLVLRKPVTVSWLSQTAGCSYPTVAKALDGLGSLVERTSDRHVCLRFLPDQDLTSLLGRAEKARSTVRYADRSGQPRSPEMHLSRLEKLGVQGLGVGGAFAARHYLPTLDLIGSPRLDLSVHDLSEAADARFINQLDPALEPEYDRRKPANVVVHFIRHADPLLAPREQGLLWVDPIECLFDLHEAHLEAQATEFMNALRGGLIVSGKQP